MSRNFDFVTHFDPPKRAKKEIFNRHQFFPTNKQYLEIKLMQNETNLWSSFLVKTKYWLTSVDCSHNLSEAGN